MIAARITCPRCGQQLTVTENAPAQVTCPRCLAGLLNPASPHSGVPRPVPVLPLDVQVERDDRAGTYLTYGLLALLSIGAVITVATGSMRGGAFAALLASGLAAFVYFLRQVRADGMRTSRTAPSTTTAGPYEPAGFGQSRVLEYGRPRAPQRPPATPGAVAGGFFSAIAVCAAGFLILGSTANFNPGGYSSGRSGTHYHALILAGVVLLVILFIVVAVRVSTRWRGFGPGATAGLVLGLMALGPCAACYLLTLG